MKRSLCMLVLFLLLLTACAAKGPGRVTCDEMVIALEENREDYYYLDRAQSVIVRDEAEIEVLLSMVSAAREEAAETSRPQKFPRYRLSWRLESGEESVFRINADSVISGTELGIGNHYFNADNTYYSEISAIFQNGLQSDAASSSP